MPVITPLRGTGPGAGHPRGARTRSAEGTSAATASPGRLPRGLLVLLGIALALGVLLGVHQLREYIGPVFLALNLVLAAAPLQTWLARRGAPRLVAALVTGLAVFTFLIAFFWALGWSIAQMVQQMPAYRTQFEELYEQGLALLARFGIAEEAIFEQLRSVISPGAIVSTLGGLLGNVGSVLGLLGTAVIVIFFLMVDSLSAGRRMDLVRDQHPRLASALTSFGQGVRRYWVVTTVFGLLVAVLDVVALLLLGVPLALAWGVLSFITNYIPNIGFVIGLVPPTLMALVANGPVNALLVLITYAALNFVVQTLVQPRFTGDAVGVNTTITFLSLLVWAWVLGPVGALLALPATLLVKAILIDADPQARWVNALVAADPETALADSTRGAALASAGPRHDP